MKNFFSAVLLAGGQSTRMGKDKALLEVNDKPLWQHQLNTLRTVQCPQEVHAEKIYLSVRQTPDWCPSEICVIEDREKSKGPLAGLEMVLDAMTTPYLLVLAIDLPRMHSSYLEKLLSLVNWEKESKGFVPQGLKWFEPLAACYPKTAVPFIRKQLQGNEYSLQQMIKNLIEADLMQAVPIQVEEENLFRNWNEGTL